MELGDRITAPQRSDATSRRRGWPESGERSQERHWPPSGPPAALEDRAAAVAAGLARTRVVTATPMVTHGRRQEERSPDVRGAPAHSSQCNAHLCLRLRRLRRIWGSFRCRRLEAWTETCRGLPPTLVLLPPPQSPPPT